MEKKQFRLEVKKVEAEIYQNKEKDEFIYNKAENQLYNLIEMAPKGDIEASIVLGKLLYQRGFYGESYNVFSDIIEKSEQKEQLCCNYLLKNSIMLGYYDDALYFLACLENVLTNNNKQFDFAIIHALLCYLNGVETKDPVSYDYYMTKEITNEELSIAFEKMLDNVANLEFEKAINPCIECINITKKAKIDLEFITLLALLNAAKEKQEKELIEKDKVYLSYHFKKADN